MEQVKEILMMNEKKPLYKLSEIAGWQKNDSSIAIPRMQRGLVWNAARVEVFWDSILRRIPVGVFSLCPMSESMREQLKGQAENASHLLLDGQQRANAIAIGFRDFPQDGYQDEQEKSPILWLDLEVSAETQSGIEDRCKYSFYMTTMAHPWGFNGRLKNSEVKDDILSSSEIAEVLIDSKLQTEEFLNNNPTWKPLPYQLYPVKAKLPIPFSVLATSATIADVKNKIQKLAGTVWHIKYGKLAEEYIATHDISRIVAIQAVVAQTEIPVLYVPNTLAADINEVSTYFIRMNTQGVIPSPEELDYSLAKANWPILWEVEDLAKDRMPPHRLATLALEVFLSSEDKDGWVNDIDNAKIRALKVDENLSKRFERFVKKNGDFYSLVYKVDKWMGLDIPDIKLQAKWSLLKFHRAALAHSRSIYRLMLILAKKDKEDILAPVRMAGLMTLLRWFSNREERLASIIARTCKSTSDLWLGIQQGISEATLKDELSIVTSPRAIEIMFSYIRDAETIKNDRYISVMNQNGLNSTYAELQKVWHGFGYSKGTELLLYATRSLSRKFEYDPSECRKWEGHNRPWDYDHVLPQNWLHDPRGRSGYGDYIRACRDVLSSIGNSAAIPFRFNRSKHASPPKDSPYYTPKVCDYLQLEIDSIFKFEASRNGIPIDSDPEQALEFVKVSQERILKLYKDWFESLEIGSFYPGDDSSWGEDVKWRYNFFQELSKKALFNGGAEFYYTAAPYQIKISEKTDWLRPWLAVGVIIPNKGFLAVASNGNLIEIGLRRLPDQNSVERDINRWYYSLLKELKIGDVNCTIDYVENALQEIKAKL
jgi:hypothetical protein